MGRLTEQARAQKETAIRAAMDRLLRSEFPPGGKCDVKTLATASGTTRAALYTTYLHLKNEFERRRDHQRDTGVIADPRDAQIDRLKQQVRQLQTRLAAKEQESSDLQTFRIQAMSRLTAQHEEITRLQTSIANGLNVRELALVRDRIHVDRPPTC